MLLSKTLVPPPTFAETWREAFDAWRGPSSTFELLRRLTTRMREYTDLQVPDAPPTKPPAPTARRGKPPKYDWPRIIGLDAQYRGNYLAKTERVPSWKRRRAHLKTKLGDDTPAVKTLQRKLGPAKQRSRGRSGA
jgi:hypothetical protein